MSKKFLNKYHSILAIVCCLFLHFAAYAEPESLNLSGGLFQLNDQEKEWISRHPYIKVSNEKNWAPFNFNANGTPLGYSIAYMNLIAEKIGVKIIYTPPLSWNEVLEGAFDKKIDVVLNITETEDRKDRLLFTDPYFNSFEVIVCNNMNLLSNMTDLAGKTVAIPKGFFYSNVIKAKYPDVKVIEVSDNTEALKLVSLGKADAVIGRDAVMRYLIREYSFLNLQVGGIVKLSDNNSAGLTMSVRNDWPILRDILNKAINSVSYSQKKHLHNMWLGNTDMSILDPSEVLTDEEKMWLSQHSTIKVQNQNNWPPFNYNKNGKPMGYSIDCMNLVAKKLGVKVQYIHGVPWSKSLDMLKNKKLDVILNIVKTPERSEFLNFTKPYARNSTVIVSNRNNIISELKDLTGKTVAIEKGFFYLEALNNEYPGVKLYEVESVLNALNLVSNGTVDACIDEEAVVRYLIHEKAITDLTISNEVEFEEGSYSGLRIGVRKGWRILTSLMNKALSSITQEQKSKLYNKWINRNVDEQSSISFNRKGSANAIYLMFALVLAALLVFLIILWIASKLLSDKLPALIKNKVLHIAGLVLMVGILTVVITVAVIGLNDIKYRAMQNVQEILAAIANATNSNFREWVYIESEHAEDVASEKEISAFTEKLLEVGYDKNLLLKNPAFLWLRTYLNSKHNKDTLTDYYIISTDDVNISANTDDCIGKENFIAKEYPQLINKVFSGHTVFVPPFKISENNLLEYHSQNSVSNMYIMCPISNSIGQAIAVLALGYNPSKDFSAIFQAATFMDTGETYAFSDNGRMLSPSKYLYDLDKIGLLEKGQSSIVNLELRDPGGNLLDGYKPDKSVAMLPLTVGVSYAINDGNSYQISEYRDYRGVTVIGYWVWNYDYNIGIMTEVDKAEVLAGYNADKNIIITILGVTLFIAFVFAGFVLWSGERSKVRLRKARDDWEALAESRYNELMSREKRFSAIFNQSIQQMVVFDNKGLILEANSIALDFAGLEIDDVSGKTLSGSGLWNDLEKPDALLDTIIERTLSGEVVRFENSVFSAAGDEILLDQMFVPVKDDNKNVAFILAMGHDITKLKHAEEEVKQARDKLELRVKERTHDLQKATDKLKTSSQMQTSLNNLLRLSMKVADLQKKQILQEALNVFSNMTWFPNSEHSALLLYNRESGELGVFCENNIPIELMDAINTSEMIKNYYDEYINTHKIALVQHDVSEENEGGVLNQKYAEYIVPIFNGEDKIGALIFFLSYNHTEQENEKAFLNSASEILASIIDRKRRIEEIERFNNLTMAREARILELKSELNSIYEDLGSEQPYQNSEEAYWSVVEKSNELSDKSEVISVDTTALSELLPVDELEFLLQKFCSAVDISTAIIDFNGNIIASARMQRSCCDFHRINQQTYEECSRSDSTIFPEFDVDQESITNLCRNGLVEIAAPLFIEGRHVANVFAGQVFTEDPNLDEFRQKANDSGFDVEDYLSAIKDVPVIDEDRLKYTLNFLTILVSMVGTLAIERKQARTLEKASQGRAIQLKEERAAAISLAEDAEKARAEKASYQEHLEELVDERTAELLESQEKTSLVLNTAAEGIFGVNTNDEVTFLNSAAAELLGYSVDELVGKRIHEIIHYSHKNGTKYDIEHCPMYRSYTDGTKHHVDSEVLWRKDGTSFDADYTSVPILVDDEIVGAVVTFRDITELNKARNEIEINSFHSDLALELTHAGYWHVDFSEPNYCFLSHRGVSLLGEDERVDGKYHFDNEFYSRIAAVDAKLAYIHKEKFTGTLEGKYDVYDATFPYKRPADGKIIWVHAVGKLLNDRLGNKKYIYGAVQDITKQKNIEKDLMDAKHQAESATKAKSDFLANMSHEIRTPMNAIMGMAHLVLKTEMTAKQRNFVRKIDSSAQSLLNIINDILDFSKIEAGKLTIEYVDFYLDEIIENVSTMIATKILDKNIELLVNTNSDVPRALYGDPYRLSQILVNLVNNAAKFTHEGEIVIRSEVESYIDDDIVLQFSVHDTGIGMSKDQQVKLFKAFSQADESTTRKYGGTGLGLSICKKLCNLMGGDIWVESEVNNGSTFFFTVVVKRSRKAKERSFLPDLDLRNLKILIVDDNATSRQILQDFLGSMEFRVDEAVCGEDAVEMLEASSDDDMYDLVILDWKMLGIDGIETARRINQSPVITNVPKMIMLTAFGREEVAKQADECGISAFLVKPVTQSTLFDSVMHVFHSDMAQSSDISVTSSFEPRILSSLEGVDILLAEDNEINQEVALGLLEETKANIDIANNGLEAVDMVKSKKYALILMDIQMPIKDGYTATEEIRGLGGDYSKELLPIVAMTANAMAGDKEKALSHGMNDHVSKPIDPDKLFETISKWLLGSNNQFASESFINDDISEVAEADIESRFSTSNVIGININEGLTRVAGKMSVYLNILDKMRNNYINAVSDIKTLIAENNFEEGQRYVHSLKGVAGNIGAMKLMQAAANVENSFDNESSDVNEMLEILENELAIVINSIQTLVPANDLNSEDEKEVGDVAELLTLLEEVSPHIKSRKPKKCEKAVEVLLNKKWPDKLDPQVKELVSLIKKYKFKPAIELTESIIDDIS